MNKPKSTTPSSGDDKAEKTGNANDASGTGFDVKTGTPKTGKRKPRRQPRKKKPGGNPTVGTRNVNNPTVPNFLQSDGNATPKYKSVNSVSSGDSLLTRIAMEYVKFSPTGEPNSLIRFVFETMLQKWRSSLVQSNVDYAIVGNRSTLTIKEFDEYIEMNMNLIITYEFYLLMYNAARSEEGTYPDEFVTYSSSVLSNVRGLRTLLNEAKQRINSMLMPSQLLDIRKHIIGVFNSDNTNSSKCLHIVGVQIPTNYDSYRILGAKNMFSRNSAKSVQQAKFGKERLVDTESLGKLPYEQESLVHVPPIGVNDVHASSTLMANYALWADTPNGTFERVKQLLQLVVPTWSMENYAFTSLNPINMNIANEVLLRNYPIPNLNKDEISRNGIRNANVTCGAMDDIIYLSPSQYNLSLMSLYLSWRTNQVTSYATGMVENVPFPGMFFRLPTTFDDYEMVGRFTISGTGDLIPYEGRSEWCSTMEWRFYNGKDGVVEHTLRKDNVITLSPTVLDEFASEFIEYVYDSHTFMSSPKFRSDFLK